MHKLLVASVLALAVLPLAACSGDSNNPADDDDTSGNPDASTPVVDGGDVMEADADYGEWKVLNEGSWTMPPGADRYFCIIKTLTEDTYIKSFKGMIPAGTHHTVLTIYTGGEPDGITECSSGTNGQNMIYGTGVGSPEFNFPAGVAVKLTAGQRVLNNLHIFNAGDSTITGTSGTLYKPIAASEVQHEAELVLTGPVGFARTAGAAENTLTITGSCHISEITSSEPINVFAVAPHMHMRGKHMKSTIVRGTAETVIQDDDYDFEAQTFTMHDSPMITLQPGDVLRTDCTYDTHIQKFVGFGDRSTDEMCFTDIFYYPKQGATFICSDGP